MSDAAYTTFPGLNQALESRWAIRKKCQAVELCLDANRDNYRGFFEQCFSQLLKQIFGYDGSSWLDQVAQASPSGEEANARALEDLLSPHGKLFRAMHSADADGLIKFLFPLERLPTHTQLLLASEGGRQELERWPQYRGRIFQDAQGRTQIHLNVLSYFLFWMAFYVLRGSQAQSLAAPTRAALYSHLNPSFGSVKKTLGLTRSQEPVEGHPYLRLLRLYLEDFLPRDDASRLADRSNGLRGSGAAGSSQMLMGLPAAAAARPAAQEHPTRGELLLSVFMEFWMADGDCPLPGAPLPGGGSGPNTPNARSGRDGWRDFNDSWGGLLSARFSSLRAVSFDPPGEDLVGALVVLARYVVSVETPGSKDGAYSLAQAGTSAWLPLSPVQPLVSMQVPRVVGTPYLPPSLGAAARPPAQAFARNLYRLLRRAFTQWPEQRAVTPIVHLWCAYIAPWWPPNGATAAASGGGQPQPSPGGAPQALRRQLSHVGELVVRRAPGEPQQQQGDASAGRFSGAQWQSHVLANMPFYSLLLPLFLEFTRSRVSFRCDESLEGLKRVLSIFAQAPELCELIAAVEDDYARFLQHPGRRPEGPYAELLPFLAEQAQDWEAAALATSSAGSPTSSALPELQMFSREAGGAAAKAQEVLTAAAGAGRDSLLADVRALAAAVLPMRAAETTATQPAGAAAAASQPLPHVRALRLGRREDLGYRGDPLRRPIASNEIAWVARALVHASEAANVALGLNRPATEEETAQGGLVQHAKEVLRKRGGVNLRNPWGMCLAEVQTLIWIPVLLTALRLSWHTLAFIWRVITEPYEEDPHPPPSSGNELGHDHSSYSHEASL